MSAGGDSVLIARSRDGDADAFRELFERKHRRVYLIAFQILGERSRAEDVVQEVFLRLWEHCADYDEAFPLDAWLRRIATNRAIDHWRARKRERVRRVEAVGDGDTGAMLDSVAAHGSTDAAAGRVDDPQARLEWRQIQAIWTELAADLTPQQRAAFALRHIEGLDASQVADALGCSPSTVRSHISEARRTLRAALRLRYPELGGSSSDP